VIQLLPAVTCLIAASARLHQLQGKMTAKLDWSASQTRRQGILQNRQLP